MADGPPCRTIGDLFMKSTRLRIAVLALLLFAAFGTLEAYAAQFCGDVCECGASCDTRCTWGGGLPTLTCGQWGALCGDCASSEPSSQLTCDASSDSSDLLAAISAPAKASVQQ
jgi:hypothetical protein